METWLVRSDDLGRSWSTPRNLTEHLGGPLALGPPGGVQLKSGRLALAVHNGSGTFALLSDDGGSTWHAGKPVGFAEGLSNGGESQLVDDLRGPDTLSMIIRVGNRNPLYTHAIAQSDDAGETWSVNATVVTNATGPTCEGSIGRLESDGSLLVSAPHNFHWRYPADRRNLTVWVLGGAKTNFTATAAVQIYPGPAAYSALSTDGTMVLFEGGPQYRYQSVMLARVPLATHFNPI